MFKETHVAFVQLHVGRCPEPVQSKAQIRRPSRTILFHVVLHIEGANNVIVMFIVSGDEGCHGFVFVRSC